VAAADSRVKKTLSLRRLVLYLVAINFKEINLFSFIYEAVLMKKS